MKLNNQQKKIIRNIAFTILTILSLLGLACYIIKQIPSLEQNDFVKSIAPYISILSFGFPIIIGFFIKYALGRHQQTQIEQTLQNYGVEIVQKEKPTKNPYKIKEPPYFEYNEFKFWVDNDKILIVFSDLDNSLNNQQRNDKLQKALNELANKIRVDLGQ